MPNGTSKPRALPVHALAFGGRPLILSEAVKWGLPNGMAGQLTNSLAFCGEHLADAEDDFALGVAEGQEFEAVAQALAVADDGANFQRVGAEGQRHFERDDFAGFELTGESCADAILAKFGGASPAAAEFAVLKHADLQAEVDGKAGKTASMGRPRGCGLIGREFFTGSGHRNIG
jgi:hypothetical protein